jgi:hypothetical protein
MSFTPNRIVVLLSPIFVSLSGLVAGFVADMLPGANLDETELTAAFVAGGLAAATAVYQWLKGWISHEEREALLDDAQFVDPIKPDPTGFDV